MVCTTKSYGLHRHDHPLSLVHDLSTFTCGRCRTEGTGTRHRCEPCDFSLHLYCAACPPRIVSSLHPSHPLTLFRKLCDHCRARIMGEFYRCDACDIDLHPLCLLQNSSIPQSRRKSKTVLPAHDRLLYHPHTIGLADAATIFTCTICKVPGTGKRYRCGACDFETHTFCASAPRTATSSLDPEEHLLRCMRKTCDECDGAVEGDFYRCKDCNFDLHPICHQKTIYSEEPEFPPTVEEEKQDPPEEEETSGDADISGRFFMHPEHELAREEAGEGRCEVCGEEVKDGWRCAEEGCRFSVHDGCIISIMPAVRDSSHGNHTLYYLPSNRRACAVCKESCIGWRYHCDACDVHVHRACLAGPPPPLSPPELNDRN